MFAQYQIFDYPYASKLNPRLYRIVVDNNNGDPVYGGAFRTDKDLHTRGIKDVDVLLTWIKQLIPQCARNFANQNYLEHFDADIGLGGRGGFKPDSFKIDGCWGIHYNKGQKAGKHNHFPYTMTFVYCVNAPDKSSPLIIEGERITPVPGRVIFFLSHQYHGTLPSKVDGRCMIVGNVLYAP